MSAAVAHSITLPVPVTDLGATSTTFLFDGEPVRLFDDGLAPWFSAGDVARSIGHRDANTLTRLLKDKEKGTRIVRTPGGEQVISVISEAGLYRAVMLRQTAGSKLAPATRDRIERFQDWVTGEVLPQIRRTGAYAPRAAAPAAGVSGMLEALKDPSTVLALIAHHAQETLAARAEAEEAKAEASVTRQALVVAEKAVEEAAPKARFYDRFASADGLYGLQNAARVFGEPPNGFCEWLRSEGILFKQGRHLVPKRDFTLLGVFEVKVEEGVSGPAYVQTFVTPRGMQYIAGLLKKRDLKRRAEGAVDLFGEAVRDGASNR